MDLSDSVAITHDIHWVGFYDKEAHLHCNPYLLIDEDDVVLIDPGSIPHFPTVMRKVIDLVSPEDISTIIISHQDPDVCGNLAVMEDVIGRKDLKIWAHQNTIRLLRHYGIRSNPYAVDENGFKTTLKSGRVLEFIFTPYLHSPGAIATYDRKTGSLFSSDIFGAVSKNWSLFAEGDFLKPMDEYHKLYMPSRSILSSCMDKFSSLPINRILPQHGSILEGVNIQKAIEHLKALPCGIDLL